MVISSIKKYIIIICIVIFVTSDTIKKSAHAKSHHLSSNLRTVNMNIEAVSHDQHVLLKKIHRKTPYPCSLRWNKIARKTGLGAERVKLWFETYNTLIQEKKCKDSVLRSNSRIKPLAKKAAVAALNHGINAIGNSQARQS